MRIEIAFGVGAFDSTTLATNGNWTDVSSSVRSASFQTSTLSDRFSVFSAGSATVELDNRARLFDPSFTTGTYYGDFKRNVPIRFIGRHSGTDYTQWRGYVTLWTPNYVNHREATTTVQAVDGIGLLARYDLLAFTPAAYGSDNSGSRVGRVLDEIGVPASYRNLDNGATMRSTTWGVNALQHCQLAAMSDAGFFYCQRDGTFTFDGLNELTTTRQTTPQVTLSHDTAPKYLAGSLVRSGVGQGYRNVVRIGGESVTTTSIDNVGATDAPVVFSRTDLLMDSQAQADSMAQFYADLYGTEGPTFTSCRCLIETIGGAGNQTTLFNVGDIRDRITVELDPPGTGSDISGDCFIDGISAQITPANTFYTYTLSSADIYDDNLASPPSNWLIVDGLGNSGQVADGSGDYTLAY